MGGKYIPLIKGEIYGLQIGIDTEMNLWEHSRKLDFEKLGGEYLIGIGVGFTKAQQIRERLRETEEDLSFEERLKLYKYLIETHGGRYGEFMEMSRHFVENVNNWGNKIMPREIAEKVFHHLKNQKIQRAVDEINTFNYENYRLELITQYKEIKNLLPKLREAKQKGQIDSIEYRKRKAEIESRLMDWVNRRKEN